MFGISSCFGQGSENRQTERAEREAGEMKWTIDMTAREIGGLINKERRIAVEEKEDEHATCCKNILPELEFRVIPVLVSLSFDYALIHMLFISFHFIFIVCHQTFAFVFSCHSLRCQFNFKTAITFHAGRQRKTLLPGITKTRSTRTHLARPPQRQNGFDVMFFMWFMCAACQTPVFLLLLGANDKLTLSPLTTHMYAQACPHITTFLLESQNRS